MVVSPYTFHLQENLHGPPSTSVGPAGDNHGTDIDHFEPIARNPLRTFDWLNHLLACSTCNSHHKRDQFPIDDDGCPLLIDPTAEDPLEHLLLNLVEGEYVALSSKGEATIKICHLNEPRLEQGPAKARRSFTACLEKWSQAHHCGDVDAEAEWAATVRLQPCADVRQAMLRQVDMPGAVEVFDEDEPRLPRLPELRAALMT